jgi:hypothetical protein
LAHFSREPDTENRSSSVRCQGHRDHADRFHGDMIRIALFKRAFDGGWRRFLRGWIVLPILDCFPLAQLGVATTMMTAR